MLRFAPRGEMLQECAAARPVTLRKIEPRIPAELATIVGKAMEFEPIDRYATAQELADDLERFLNDRPILAHPPTLRRRLVKWSRRHVGTIWTVLFGLMTAVVVLGGSAMMIAGSRDRADRQRAAAVRERNQARQQQYYAEMIAGQLGVVDRNLGRLYSQLVNHLPLPGEQDRREWEWYFLMSQCRRESRTLVFPGMRPNAAWSPDGRYIGAPGALWEAATGDRIRRFSTSNIYRTHVAWSPDSEKFAWGRARDEDAVYVWDRRENKLERWANLSAVAWSPDGRWLAAALDKHGLVVWDVQQRRKATDRPGHVLGISWRPQGDVLAVCERERWLLLDPTDWSMIRQVEHPRGQAVAWSPDGSQLAVAHGETVAIWDSSGETKLRELQGHRLPVVSVSWGPAGRQLVTADSYRSIKLWNLDRGEQPLRIDAGNEIQSIAWHDGDRTVLTVASEDGSSAWWDTRDGTLQGRTQLAVSPPYQLTTDRKFAAVLSEEKDAVSVVDTGSGETRALLHLPAGRNLSFFTISGDGGQVVTQEGGRGDFRVRVWDVDQERQNASCTVPTIKAFRFAVWSPSANRLAAVGTGDVGEDPTWKWLDHVHVFDVSEGQRIWKFHSEGITALDWSRDERFLAVGMADGHVDVFDVDTGARRFRQQLHRQGVSSLAWHPHGQRLACAAQNGEIKLVTADKGLELLSLYLPEGPAVGLSWSHDGQRLAAANRAGQVHIWDASRAYEFSAGGSRRASPNGQF